MRGQVVIPAFNEAESLGEVLGRIAAQSLPVDVVVVDDGSRDGTAAVAAAHGARVVSHSINLGYGRALQTGMRHALQSGRDYCVTLDADGQHDPADIAKLLERAQAADRPHIVIGSRFASARRYQAPLGRRLGMLLFSLLTRLVGGRRIYDTTSGFRYLSRTALEHLAGLSAGDLHSEMIIYCLLRGLVVVELPIVMSERRRGESMYTAVSSLVYPLKTLLSICVLLVQARREGRLGHA